MLQDSPVYVGMGSHTHGLEDENGKNKKKEENDMGEKREKAIKKKLER